MVPNMILLIYKLQTDHDLFNATKLKQIKSLNFLAPFADLATHVTYSSPTITSNQGPFGNPTW